MFRHRVGFHLAGGGTDVAAVLQSMIRELKPTVAAVPSSAPSQRPLRRSTEQQHRGRTRHDTRAHHRQRTPQPSRRGGHHHGESTQRSRHGRIDDHRGPLARFRLAGFGDDQSASRDDAMQQAIVRDVARAVQMERRMAEAKHLLEQLSTFGCSTLHHHHHPQGRRDASVRGNSNNDGPFAAVSRRAVQEMKSSTASPRSSTPLQIAEERGGIVGRVHRQQQRQRMRAVSLLLPSDLQLAELLHNGRVVTLTHITLPSEVTSLVLPWEKILLRRKERREVRRGGAKPVREAGEATETRIEEEEEGAPLQSRDRVATAPQAPTCSPPSCGPQFLHVVLHKTNMTLDQAVQLMASSTGLPTTSFQVNCFLDDRGCTTQVCSVQLPPALLSPDDDDANQRVALLDVLQRLFRLNLQPVPMRIQWLRIRDFSCGPNTAAAAAMGGEATTPQTGQQEEERERTKKKERKKERRDDDRRGYRCTMMLRGFSERPSAVRAAAKRALLLYPNYFAPRRFFMGDAASQPFYWYHVGEAVSRGQYACALMMLTHSIWHYHAVRNESDACTRRIEELFLSSGAVPPYPQSTRGDVAPSDAMRFITAFASLVRGGETSEQRYKHAYEDFVPMALKQLVETSRSCLVFNTILSLRLHRLHRGKPMVHMSGPSDEMSDTWSDVPTRAMLGGPLVGDIVALMPPSPPALSLPGAPGSNSAEVTSVAEEGQPNIDETLRCISSWFDASETGQANIGSAEQPVDDGGRPTMHQNTIRHPGQAHASRLSPLSAAGFLMGGEQFSQKVELAGDAVPIGKLHSNRERSPEENPASAPPPPPPVTLKRVAHDAGGGHKDEEDVISMVDATAEGGVVVLPLGYAGSPDLRRLWARLGLSPPHTSGQLRRENGMVRRAFLGSMVTSPQFAGGDLHHGNFPVRMRTLPEVTAGGADGAKSAADDGGGLVRLATDTELLRSAKQFSGQASSEHGITSLWSIGRIGHVLSDRLPIGAFMEANVGGQRVGGEGSPSSASSGGTPLSSSTTTLAVQFDVPVGGYISSMLREFVSLRSPTSEGVVDARHEEEHHRKDEHPSRSTSTSHSKPKVDDVSEPQGSVAVVDGDLMGLTLAGGMPLQTAVRTGRVTDLLASGRSVNVPVEG